MINLNDRILVKNHEKYVDYIGNDEGITNIHFVLTIFDKDQKDEYYKKYCSKLRNKFLYTTEVQNHKVLKINDDDSSYKHQFDLISKYIKKYREFIDSGLDIDFIASCKGGVSRSPAIAAAILRYFRLNGYIADEMIIFKNGKYTPNMHVFELLCNSLKVPVSKEELDKMESINLEAWKKVHKDDLE